MTGIRTGLLLAALVTITATPAAADCVETTEGRRYQCGEWVAARDVDEMTDSINWTVMTYLPNAGVIDTWPSLSVFCRSKETMLLVAPGSYLMPPYNLTLRIDSAKAQTVAYLGAPGTAAVVRGKQAKALVRHMSAGQTVRTRINTTSGQETFSFDLQGFSDALALTPCKP